MNERIKLVRKRLGLTQQKFADTLNIKRGAIANYEIGRNEPIDAVISLICEKFNVNEEWLRTGEGDMFLPLSGSQSLDMLAKINNATEADYQLIRNYLSLDPSVRLQLQSIFSFKE